MERQEPVSREQLLARAVDLFDEVWRSGRRTVPQEWFTLDLTMPQVRVVFLLLEESPLRMSDLASALGISFSRATGVVDKLVEGGLVARWTDPEDRRSVRCVLSEPGKELGRRLLEQRRARWEERLVNLSPGELAKVCKVMELVQNAVRRSGPVEPPVAASSGSPA